MACKICCGNCINLHLAQLQNFAIKHCQVIFLINKDWFSCFLLIFRVFSTTSYQTYWNFFPPFFQDEECMIFKKKTFYTWRDQIDISKFYYFEKLQPSHDLCFFPFTVFLLPVIKNSFSMIIVLSSRKLKVF